MSVGQPTLPAMRCGTGGGSGLSIVIDDFNRDALGIEVYFNLPAARVVRTLDWMAAGHGYPRKLRLDKSTRVHLRHAG
jgi:hypothetical protein